MVCERAVGEHAENMLPASLDCPYRIRASPDTPIRPVRADRRIAFWSSQLGSPRFLWTVRSDQRRTPVRSVDSGNRFGMSVAITFDMEGRPKGGHGERVLHRTHRFSRLVTKCHSVIQGDGKRVALKTQTSCESAPTEIDIGPRRTQPSFYGERTHRCP